MIVYSANKGQFVQDVRTGVIAHKILNLIRERGLNAGQDREFESWHNSMKFMRDIVDDRDINDEVQIAIEYNIPQTSKRVDFIIIGANENGKDNIVIVELKQWTKAEVVDDDMHFSVRTYVANDNRIVCHPSYQAYSYSRFIGNYSQVVHSKNINLVPCAYLHNYLAKYKQALALNATVSTIKNQTEAKKALEKTKGLFGEAIPYFEKARECAPDEPMKWAFELRQCYSVTGQAAKAAEMDKLL